jgi:EAL domain-containing protein (putative c-di-GMP-specific phosphodiesterase class I)
VALYNAKRSGRNRTSVFNRADMEEMRLTKEIADDIVRGLAAGEFVPFYQPQVDAQTRDLVGIEALARWRHPGKGILAPAHFIRVATEMNVIADIDRSIFDRALLECGEIFAAHSAYPSLSFNISAKRLEHDIINEIGDAAKTYPGEVAFELLETIFMEEESEDFLMRIDQLREFGVKIEVDDFGSGRASIVALQRIAPDRLKIDQRLVSPIGQSRSAKKLVASIVEIGHALDINVVAEGVESEEQVHLLAALGVERLQGYHIAPPLSKPELTAFLASHPLRSHAG